jgi:RHS repeat-associated protein
MEYEGASGSKELHFYYDAIGRPLSFTYKEGANAGVTYYYVLNLQGDVVAILDSTGRCVVEYVYDAWGQLIEPEEDEVSAPANYNPLRYRGYVYDRETGLYYLESRYYNPEMGRFINADRYISTGTGILGFNMFAYCNNNQTRYVDYSGEFVEAFLEDADDGLGFIELLGVGDCGGGTYHYVVDTSFAERSSLWDYPL